MVFIDIQIKEPTLESLVKKKKEYKPTKMMEVKEACSQLLQAIGNETIPGNKSKLYLVMNIYLFFN